MNTICIRKILELYKDSYSSYFHEYQCYLFCYTSLLKIVEHTYLKYKKEDILTGVKYLLHTNMIFCEYKHNCVDLIRRGILENMFAIYDENILYDGVLDQNDTDFVVESLCMELEDDLVEIKKEQDKYLDEIKYHKLYTIIEEDEGSDATDNDL